MVREVPQGLIPTGPSQIEAEGFVLRPLGHEFYARETNEVARDLVGRVLAHEVNGELLAGIIVETEAYGPDDPASHAYSGKTKRNEPMFGPPGHTYLYRIYGIHWCVNAVTEYEGIGEAVLIRALEPLLGIETMRRNRRLMPDDLKDSDTGVIPSITLRRLCRGPGSLCQALGITGALNGHDLTRPPLFISGDPADLNVIATTRIGISKAEDRPWRFLLEGNPYISRPPS